jgi:hypothetical protein
MQAAATQRQPRPAKSTVDRAQQWLGLASTTVGLLGAVGAFVVWLGAGFYTGVIEIRPAVKEPVQIKVFDARGHESTYHTRHLQLAPGNYHLEIASTSRPQTFDAEVQFGRTTVIELAPDSQDDPGSQGSEKKRRWWQFWRHGE